MLKINKDELQSQLSKWEEMQSSNAHGRRLWSISVFFFMQCKKKNGDDWLYALRDFDEISKLLGVVNTIHEENGSLSVMLLDVRSRLAAWLNKNISYHFGNEVLEIVRP